ncbi:glycosyltransferase family A protein [Geobacter sp. SVR]|uniref:glycosyltransferase family A protein n=1 Tax=Geobacter sp. SVR TaxID=2495594 RepID=UPI00143EF850|nr:glycosyltransferase family A protein [Geobacter sp. SVR]BCS55978.1 hypothetical protein GSVR_42860 [Geobacter sp. SVR]GCF84741.1 hypothetical protein GSbR_13410 [Geobacter sp. SVR]
MTLDNFNIIVLIPTEDCINYIDASINSVLIQTYNRNNIKIVAIDNCSTDGTYEKLLNYSINHGISVYRLKEKCSRAMLLYESISYIEPVNYKYITVLSPGDIFYSNFIEDSVKVMEKYSNAKRRMLICEVSIIDSNARISSQLPIFTDSCILKSSWSLLQFFTFGFDHRVQWICLKDTLPSDLADLVFCVDNTDWFNKALFSFNSEIIYLDKPLASAVLSYPDDRLYKLMLKLSLVTRFKLIRGTMDNKNFEDLDELEDQKLSNYKLSLLALKYAYDDLIEIKIDSARKILLFAEMVFSDIVETELYSTICNLIEKPEYCSVVLDQHFDFLLRPSNPPTNSISMNLIATDIQV